MLFLTVFSFFIGGSSTELQETRMCYGGSLAIPPEYTPPNFSGKLAIHRPYFTTVLFEYGKVKDSRIEIYNSQAHLRNLRELDEGTFVVTPDVGGPFSIIKLKIDECADEITTYYGSHLSWPMPVQAEYMEFSRTYIRKGMAMILWRRDGQNHDSERGRLSNNAWEVQHATQASNGIYDVRAKDKTLLKRKNVTVQEHTLHFHKDPKERLVVKYPTFFVRGDVTFTPRGSSYPDYSAINERFKGRIEIADNYMVIDPVESSDSGTFQFEDLKSYPVMTVHLKVKGDDVPVSVSTIGIVGGAVGIILVITVCCCCMKKHRQKSSQSNELASYSAAANATNCYVHDTSFPIRQ